MTTLQQNLAADAQRLADIREAVYRVAPLAWLSPVTVADTRWLLAEVDRLTARLALAERVAEAVSRCRAAGEVPDSTYTEYHAAIDAYELATKPEDAK